MSLGLRDGRRRRRQQVRWAILRWLLALALLIGAGVYAYQTGSRLAERNVESLQDQVRRLEGEVSQLSEQARVQGAQLAAERARAEDWRLRYEQVVPSGETKALVELIQAKAAEGLTLERLRFVVDRTPAKRECDKTAQIRNVLVQTPISRAVAPAIFAGGGVRMVLSGASARDGANKPEAWFDPQQPITVRFTWPDGRTAETSGMLPLSPSSVEGDREYRFRIAPGARGFAQVTLERCRFP